VVEKKRGIQKRKRKVIIRALGPEGAKPSQNRRKGESQVNEGRNETSENGGVRSGNQIPTRKNQWESRKKGAKERGEKGEPQVSTVRSRSKTFSL